MCFEFFPVVGFFNLFDGAGVEGFEFFFDGSGAGGGDGSLDAGVFFFFFEKPGGETVFGTERVAVEAVVDEVGFGFGAGGNLLGEGHGFGGDDVDVCFMRGGYIS